MNHLFKIDIVPGNIIFCCYHHLYTKLVIERIQKYSESLRGARQIKNPEKILKFESFYCVNF